jgi:hypothetical protein
MTIQAQVSAFGALLLFQSEREVNRDRKGRPKVGILNSRSYPIIRAGKTVAIVISAALPRVMRSVSGAVATGS